MIYKTNLLTKSEKEEKKLFYKFLHIGKQLFEHLDIDCPHGVVYGICFYHNKRWLKEIRNSLDKRRIK